MKNSVLCFVFFVLVEYHDCASVGGGVGNAQYNNGYPATTTSYTTTTTITTTTYKPSEPGSSYSPSPKAAAAPVWSPTLGQFIMGQMPKYDRSNKDSDYNATNPTPPPPPAAYPAFFNPYASPMCPPCQCMQRSMMQQPKAYQMFQQPPVYQMVQQQPAYQMVHQPAAYQMVQPQPPMFPSYSPPHHDDDDDDDDDNDHTRSRRSTSDNYWYSTGPANPVLSAINMGYNAQTQIRDYISKYGPPLHMGYISPSDFNYPNDFHAFEQPGMGFQNIPGNIIYELRGPLEVKPVGSLVGPITGAPDSFSTLVLQSGKFRLIAIQKDGMMKLADVSSNVVYLVDCNGQRNGGCQNLVVKMDGR